MQTNPQQSKDKKKKAYEKPRVQIMKLQEKNTYMEIESSDQVSLLSFRPGFLLHSFTHNSPCATPHLLHIGTPSL